MSRAEGQMQITVNDIGDGQQELTVKTDGDEVFSSIAASAAVEHFAEKAGITIDQALTFLQIMISTMGCKQEKKRVTHFKYK